jgi:hypothetical protein
MTERREQSCKRRRWQTITQLTDGQDRQRAELMLWLESESADVGVPLGEEESVRRTPQAQEA